MSQLATRLAHQLVRCPEEHRWLIQGLWADQAVGIVGGEPKSFKSFLAQDIAVAVASGAPCLRRFPTVRRGPVLLFAAEDALHIVRSRLEGIAQAADVSFEQLAIHVITTPTVRIDLEADRKRLRDTVGQIRPRLLVLDPFVRLHRVDENLASEVAPLLAYLREIQRRYETAVLLVHHSRKGGHARAGQALRGSSELHAWGDSNLYLRRQQDDRLLLAVEHRAAAASPTLDLELAVDGQAVALTVIDSTPPREPCQPTPADRVLDVLAATHTSLTRRALREACRMRASTIGHTLTDLLNSQRIIEDEQGYRLPPN
jgi:AAA domain